MRLLREWRALSGGAGVPVIAHGNDMIVGFNPARLELMLDACARASDGAARIRSSTTCGPGQARIASIAAASSVGRMRPG